MSIRKGFWAKAGRLDPAVVFIGMNDCDAQVGMLGQRQDSPLIHECIEFIADSRVFDSCPWSQNSNIIELESSLFHHIPLLESLLPSLRPSEEEVGNDGQDRNTHQRNSCPAAPNEHAALVCRDAEPRVVVEEATDALDHEMDEDGSQEERAEGDLER